MAVHLNVIENSTDKREEKVSDYFQNILHKSIHRISHELPANFSLAWINWGAANLSEPVPEYLGWKEAARRWNIAEYLSP